MFSALKASLPFSAKKKFTPKKKKTELSQKAAIARDPQCSALAISRASVHTVRLNDLQLTLTMILEAEGSKWLDLY